MGALINWIAKLVVFAVIFVILVVILQKKTAKDFDERQNILRGNAFRRAFFAMAFIALLYSNIALTLGPFMEDGVSEILLVCIGADVFAVDCILHDAFFTVKEKPWLSMLCTAFLAALHGTNGMRDFRRGLMVKDGLLTLSVVYFMLAADFIVLFLAVVIKAYVIKGDAE
jgi:hypothetical protein